MEATPQQRALLERHLELVIDANQKTNITRIDTWDEGWLLHVEDSLAGLDEVEAAPTGELADLGSGAGFPGIPLAISTGRSVTLVESVGKKATLLKQFAEDLELSERVSVFSGRAEELAREEGARYSVITARALSSLPSLMELASPLLTQGGMLVCYKSSDIDAEMEQALVIQEKLAMYFKSRRDTSLSDGTPRSIVTFVKDGDPLVKLPRREGQAQRKPYKK